MRELISFTVWCTAIYYLVAASELTRGLRRHAPGFVLALLLCPVCAGFWIGLLSASYLPAPWIGDGQWWERALWGGLYGMFLTPVGNAIRRQSLELGSRQQGGKSIEELQRELLAATPDD